MRIPVVVCCVAVMALSLPTAAGALGLPDGYPRTIAGIGAADGVTVSRTQAAIRLVSGNRVRVTVFTTATTSRTGRRLVLAVARCSGSASSPTCRSAASARLRLATGRTVAQRTFTIARPARRPDALRIMVLVTRTKSAAVPLCSPGARPGAACRGDRRFALGGDLLMGDGTWRSRPGTRHGTVLTPPPGVTVDSVFFNSRTYSWTATSRAPATAVTSIGYPHQPPARLLADTLKAGVRKLLRRTPSAGTAFETRPGVRTLLYSATLADKALFSMRVPVPRWGGQEQSGWTPPRQLTSSMKDVRDTTVAINARGDAAVAWTVDPPFLGSSGHLRIRVAYRRGWTGAFATRTVVDRPGITARGLTVALDGRGELSLAWIDQHVTRGLLHGRKTVRAAYRTPTGRWSRVQAIGSASPFAYAFTTLAAAPDGTVLLTYNARVRAAPGMASVWRSPGHSFGAVRALPTGKGGLLQEPTTLFDGAGRAYVAGILRCGDTRSRGVLMTAAPGRRSFTSMRTVAPPPAHHLRIALTGAGRGALAWRHVGCSTTEDLSGPVHGARLLAVRATAPVVIDPRPTGQLWLSAARFNEADAAWTAFPATGPEAVIAEARMSDAGAWTTPTSPSSGWVAVAADADGNQTVQTMLPLSHGAATSTAARTATGAIQVAPLTGSRFPFAAAGNGGGLIAAATGGSKLTVSTWRP